jgi:glycosyltransferase involved in cell wall biosynthesis
LAISNYIKKKVCGGKNSIVIPCGTEEDKVCNGRSLRRELGFSDRDFVVGFVGTLSRNKNYDKVVAAVEQMPDRFKCLLVGKSDGTPLSQGKKTKVISVKNKDISSAYSTVDCVVLPSLQEGMPLVMWEAMANRVPFLTTACSSQSDFVVHNVNSIIVSPDPESIAKECTRLSEDRFLAEFITQNAYDLFLKNGTMDATLDAFKRAIRICDKMKVF